MSIVSMASKVLLHAGEMDEHMGPGGHGWFMGWGMLLWLLLILVVVVAVVVAVSRAGTTTVVCTGSPEGARECKRS
ncbi:MAG: hypothetical protein F7C33_03445 [Desulfurococcales archaeon]|nr:hypothetical protein [Desulfurococcales archaeon]